MLSPGGLQHSRLSGQGCNGIAAAMPVAEGEG
jgi:hypothetical protein